MKKSVRILFLLLVIFALFSLIGCPAPAAKDEKDNDPEFSGVWVMTASGVSSGTDRLTFTGTSYVMETNISGMMLSMVGTMTVNIVSYDETANHILGTVTGATGIYAGISGIMYITYSISGTSFYCNYSTSSYPATAPNGPYIKQ